MRGPTVDWLQLDETGRRHSPSRYPGPATTWWPTSSPGPGPSPALGLLTRPSSDQRLTTDRRVDRQRSQGGIDLPQRDHLPDAHLTINDQQGGIVWRFAEGSCCGDQPDRGLDHVPGPDLDGHHPAGLVELPVLQVGVDVLGYGASSPKVARIGGEVKQLLREGTGLPQSGQRTDPSARQPNGSAKGRDTAVATALVELLLMCLDLSAHRLWRFLATSTLGSPTPTSPRSEMG